MDKIEFGQNSLIPTGIHTRVNSKFRISSIYRNWGITAAPEMCGWETFIWEKQPDKEREEIVFSDSTQGNAQAVVDLHAKLYNNILGNNGEWKQDEDI
jgi:hypothetical protein